MLKEVIKCVMLKVTGLINNLILRVLELREHGHLVLGVREHRIQRCREHRLWKYGSTAASNADTGKCPPVRTLVPSRVRVTIRVRELHYLALKIIRQRLQQRLLFKFRRESEEAEKLPMMTE